MNLFQLIYSDYKKYKKYGGNFFPYFFLLKVFGLFFNIELPILFIN